MRQAPAPPTVWYGARLWARGDPAGVQSARRLASCLRVLPAESAMHADDVGGVGASPRDRPPRHTQFG